MHLVLSCNYTAIPKRTFKAEYSEDDRTLRKVNTEVTEVWPVKRNVYIKLKSKNDIICLIQSCM